MGDIFGALLKFMLIAAIGAAIYFKFFNPAAWNSFLDSMPARRAPHQVSNPVPE